VSWPQEEFRTSPGESLVAITDGVTDALGEEGARFGEDRLNEVLKKGAGEPVAKLLDRVTEALDGFEIGEQADDMALLLMRFRGEG
jgi:serine phosphatase RsbU (regulator of sigma subunit)